ncbi:Hydrogenase expression/formation protein HupN [Rubrivivax sp. A210]|uniref:HypC/HybG/HupF family hydrogenase formation chaperone n=1 Tax=Rubrivivax sp. A210 TaxID=2772301 RepID=UPI0019184236|nr:HypC/HybG/HupF family hydrogenase formation chaperone [Rubrivivax sp. A210]CAD5375019.1 Hydrogenase expression/formation protein HupN [Rubrivivax sp. A210]
MCLGTPLQVQTCLETQAWCEADGEGEWLDMMLVGAQPPGTWVLGFQGTARLVMTPDEAAQARAGRAALAAVQRGDADVDAFFADLVGRVPELPPHLRGPASESA